MAKGMFASTFILGIVLINSIFSVVAEQESLVFSLVQNHLSTGAKGSDANLRVKITDKAGNAASKAKVTLTKATSRADKKAVTTNQELKAVDATTYELDFVSAAKPALGIYDLDFAVVPEDTKYEPIKSTKKELKVVGQVTVDAQIAVSDYSSPDDLGQAKKYNAKYPEGSDSKISVDSSQYVFVTFSLQSGGKPFSAHQVVASLVNKENQLETVVAASHEGSKYTIALPIASFADDFYGNSGDYQLNVVVGDTLMQAPFSWKAATLSLKFPDSARKPLPESPFAAKKEIQHIFRVPEKRPPLAISSAFSLAVLSPWAILFFGFIFVGANIKNFPTDAGFIWAVGFQATLGAILALFALYWLRLNMVQTLTYLTVLAVPFLFFSQKALNHLAVANAANAKKTQ